MIVDGRVMVNGRPAVPGQQVDAERDRITVDGKPIALPAERTYLVLNKPPGVLTSVGDPRGRPTVTDQLDSMRRLFPVGRLDLDSRGLLLLTDDGDLAMRVMHPRYGVEKEYHVEVEGQPDESALRRLREGIVIRGEQFQPAQVRVLRTNAAGTRLAMVLREGRKREVRRMWQALGHEVADLQRVRIDGVWLGDLPEGEVRPLTPDEVAGLKRAVS